MARLAREQGVKAAMPPEGDPDWSLSHAAYLAAERRGAGRASMLALFRKRFSEGEDLGDERVVAAALREAGLDAESVLDEARSEPLREEAAAGWVQARERDGVFGVPSFVFAGRLYWGQDRMRFLRSAVERKLTRPTS